MKSIKLADMTLCAAGGKSGYSLSFKEKIEVAKLLDKLCISVIETAPITNVKIDSLLIKSMAAAVKSSTLSVPVGLTVESVGIAWEAAKTAAKARLRVCVPTSAVQMEYICKMKAPALNERVRELVSACKAVCADVEFVAEDATRAEESFLAQVIETAIDAGAGTVTICDTAGIMMPDEFAELIGRIRAAVPAMENIAIGALCSNELKLAAACSVSAMRSGCSEIKVSAAAEHVPSLEAVAQIIRTRGETLGFSCGVSYTQLQRSVKQLLWITHSQRSKNSPFDNGVQSEGADGVELTAHDDMSAVSAAVMKLGYDLSEEDSAKVYEEFKRIAEKKTVGNKELEVIVASVALQVPPTYQLEGYVINSVNTGAMATASAHIILKKGDKTVQGICPGDGPVDASILAIEQIVGHHYELDDFQIQSVTEGREAMGATLVRLRSNGKLYSGRGVATDIIGSSIRAYLNALNKIVYEEN